VETADKVSGFSVALSDVMPARVSPVVSLACLALGRIFKEADLAVSIKSEKQKTKNNKNNVGTKNFL
jgi:hypothetical protein